MEEEEDEEDEEESLGGGEPADPQDFLQSCRNILFVFKIIFPDPQLASNWPANPAAIQPHTEIIWDTPCSFLLRGLGILQDHRVCLALFCHCLWKVLKP